MKEYEQKIHNIINNAEEDVIFQAHQAYEQGYATGYDHGKRDGYADGKADTPFTDTEEAEKKAYSRGLNDAWELVKRIESTPEDGGLTNEQIVEVFGQSWSSFELYRAFSAEEAMDLMKAYEDKQKQDAEIKVGDEVYSEMYDLRFIVTRIYDGRYEGVCTDGAAYCPLPDDVKKTGRYTETILKVLGEFDEKD